MALQTLSKTNITNGNVVQAADVSQSIDAFTGAVGYAITLSGSFAFAGQTTGSGYFATVLEGYCQHNIPQDQLYNSREVFG